MDVSDFEGERLQAESVRGRMRSLNETVNYWEHQPRLFVVSKLVAE
jgi:hypothetical protein